MITVELSHSTVGKMFHQWNLHFRSPITGRQWTSARNYIFVAGKVESEFREIDTDTIRTTPSGLSGENNCFHYKTFGHLKSASMSWRTKGEKYGSDVNNIPRFDIVINNGSETGEPLSELVMICSEDGSVNMESFTWTYNDWWDGREIHRVTPHSCVFHDVEIGADRGEIEIKATETVTWEKFPGRSESAEFSFSVWTSAYSSDQYWTGPTYGLHLAKGAWFPKYHFELTPVRESLIREILWRADREYSFGDATGEAAESVRLVNINSLSYLKEFAEIGQLAKQIYGLAGKVYKPLAVVGKAANAYLLWHYGVRLTVKDTLEIADAIEGYDALQKTQTMGASHTHQVWLPGSNDEIPVSVNTRCTAFVDYFSNNQRFLIEKAQYTKRALYELDLAPSAANLWDMVPFSFVADWFIPLGDALEKIELRDYIQTLGVHRAFYSRRIMWAEKVDIDVDAHPITGSVSYEIYTRDCSRTLILPPLRVDRPKGLSGHWLEAAALIFGRLS